MNILLISFIVIIVVLLILALYIISCYNKLVRVSTAVEESKYQIDSLLQMRTDLIPNLVSTIQGFVKHESDVLKQLSKDKSSEQLSVLVENYPELKSDSNFLHLQNELVSIENRIAQSRQLYNANVSDLNEMRNLFPYILFSNKIDKAMYHEVSEEDKKAVFVRF